MDLIKGEYARYDDPTVSAIDHDEPEKITALLEGHAVVKVAEDHLMLDDGTLLKIVPNQGGCVCGAGDYRLAELNSVENVITKVELVNRPNGDDHYDDEERKRVARENGLEEWEGFYRIFVYAAERRLLVDIHGSDGNGWYGTGYSILVRRPA